MKRIGTIGLAAFLAVTLAGTVLAAATVNLGTAEGFAVLAGETITNTGPTTITGDVGLHPGAAVTGFETVTLNGAQHVGDAVALDAKSALVTAYDQAAGATPVTSVPTELGGTTLTPGVYGVYIFQAASTLITASNSEVSLINGASACDVYWQVGSSATLATGTSFKGTIMALTSIALQTGATLQGRALAQTGAVTLDNNTIDSSACAAPSPADTPTPAPEAAPTSGANPAATAPPTDTLASAPPATTGQLSATLLVLLAIGALALVGSHRFASIRSRPRD
jgi:hypothetical protein